MKHFDLFFPIFNILLGIVMTLTGFGKMKMKEPLTEKRMQLFKILGAILIAGGAFQLLLK